MKIFKVKKIRNLILMVLLYFSIVPIFALLYRYTDASFYHSTIISEPKYKVHLDSFYSLLEKNLSESLKSGSNDNEFNVTENWSVNNGNITASNFILDENNNVYITYQIEFHKKISDDQILATMAYAKIKILPFIQQYYNSNLTLLPIDFENVFLSESNNPEIVKKVFRYSNVDFLNNTDYIRMNDEEYSNYLSFISMHNGFPSMLKDNFIRMLYFSAVTITTLGYGDIVPLTNFTRFLIIIESILGIIIAGLIVSMIFDYISFKSIKTNNMKTLDSIRSMFSQMFALIADPNTNKIEVTHINNKEELKNIKSKIHSIKNLSELDSFIHFLKQHSHLNSGFVSATSNIDDEVLFCIYQIFGTINTVLINLEDKRFDENAKLSIIKQNIEIIIQNIEVYDKLIQKYEIST